VGFHSREHSSARPRLELIPLRGKVRPIKAVASASKAASGTAASYVLDGKLSTYFASDGQGAQITLDLGAPKTVDGLSVAHVKGDQRIAFFEVQASTDAKTWTTLRGAQSGGDSLAPQYVPLPKTSARYLRLVGLGNAQNSWFSISEVRVRGP